MWPDRTLIDLLGIELPIVQAPMAGASGSALAIAVSEAGGLGSLPCAMLDATTIRAEVGLFRQRTNGPINLNFFCHKMPETDLERESRWRSRLAAYYSEFNIDPAGRAPASARTPFDDHLCEVVETERPKVVSFHFGLPDLALLERVKSTGCIVLSSATTVREAEWLEAHGCDAIIAQGYEAGGHRGMFLTDDIATQPGTFALVPQVVDAVNVPVIAAGGIADGRGIAAAFALGAAGVQIGTAYLKTPQSLISDLHRAALASAADDKTSLTNLFTGRPARSLLNRVMREVGPMSDDAPAFPTAGYALAPLKVKAESLGTVDFSSLWSGQTARVGIMGEDAGELTLRLAADARQRLKSMAGTG
ncbi:MAG: nitronate monooxygenase [Gammaproteobacteria bacterium]|nr:nitronate monooxygenase [Gammaproteobacteria bacterium]